MSLFLILSACLFSGTTSMQYQGHWGEPSLDGHVQLRGNYAYSLTPLGFLIMDISDAAQPRVAGHLEPYWMPEDFAISGQYLYLTLVNSLQIYDISNGSNPVLVTSYLTDLYLRNLSISGTNAFVSDIYGVSLFDITNPIAPVFMGRYLPGSIMYDIAASGKVVYLAKPNNFLEVVDFSDPANPTQIQNFSGGYGHLEVHEPYLFATKSSGINILAILKNGTLTIADSKSLSGQFDQMTVSDHYLLVSCGDSGFRIFDLDQPGFPLLGTFSTPDSNEGVIGRDGIAYLANGTAGFQTVDFSDPAKMQELGRFSQNGRSGMVEITGSIGLLAHGRPGLRLLDLSEPTGPTLDATFQNNSGASVEEVAWTGEIAFLASQYEGLKVLDFHDPANPTLIGQVLIDCRAEHIVIQDSMLLLSEACTLNAYDISDPLDPVLLGKFTAQTDIYNFAFEGTLALANDYDHLVAIDFSDPLNPTQLGTFYGIEYGCEIILSGSTAYVSDGDRTYCLDISDPSKMAIFQTIEYPNYGSTALADGLLYINNVGGTGIFDVGNPAAPRYRGTQPMVRPDTLHLQGDQVWITRNGRLELWQLHHCNADENIYPSLPAWPHTADILGFSGLINAYCPQSQGGN